jgi:hypothetical protein
MNNVKMTVAGNILTVEIDLTKDYGPSKSEKSIIVATSAGNASVPEHSDIKIGINVFKTLPKTKK